MDNEKDYIEDTLKTKEVSVRELHDRVIERRLTVLEAKTPASIVEHKDKFKDGIWTTYTVNELGMWVHLFLKRAMHRSDKAKARKDVMDAQNYLNMMQSKIDAVRKDVS